MDAFEIHGPCRLDGEISISGAKNASLPILFASLMCSEEVEFYNVPDVIDIQTTKQLFKELGVPARFKKNTFKLSPQKISKFVAPYEHVKKMRASILCLGPLLARYGEVTVSFPGGCAIGARPINLHLMGMQRLGAELEVKEGYVVAKARRLKGATIRFPKKTVTGTANVLTAAVLAQGETCILNAAREPEIVDLCMFLRQCGAHIQGEGSPTLKIKGVKKLKGGSYTIMPDRVEWGTYAMAAAATGGEVTLKSPTGPYLNNIVRKLRSANVIVKLDAKQQETVIQANEPLKAVSISTRPYPGFPTDLQAQWMAMMTQAHGLSTIDENVFENRFMHVPELSRLGAQIELRESHQAIVHGKSEKLSGTDLMASDIRASAGLVIAALVAEGRTRIRRIYHLDRGYSNMDQKLKSLGVKIRRIQLPL